MTTTTLPSWAQSGTDLTGSTVLVIGGAGGVGEGVTAALLDAGATVVATGRNRPKLDDLATRLTTDRLFTEAVDLLDPRLPETLAAVLDRHGPFDGAVVSVADWGTQGRKRLIDLTDQEWAALIAQNQTTVFRAYRSLIPMLRANAVIAQLNGLSADLPFPGAGGVALTAAATKSMTRTIAEELRGDGPRIYEIILGVIATRARRLAGLGDPRWIPATDVGVHIAELVAATSPLTGSVLHYLVDRATGPQAG
jgi:NAD(P)-dependent dehydrogenase (short-subunit alcohol dehydrogenase family)